MELKKCFDIFSEYSMKMRRQAVRQPSPPFIRIMANFSPLLTYMFSRAERPKCRILEIMKDTVFTKIIRGDIPCHKVYEDAHTFAFLDIHPIQPGHILVVTKQPVEFVWDLDSDNYQALMRTVQKVGRHMRKILGQTYIAQAVVGTDVPHVHVHLFPIQNGTDFRAVPPTDPADGAELAAIAQKLRMEDDL